MYFWDYLKKKIFCGISNSWHVLNEWDAEQWFDSWDVVYVVIFLQLIQECVWEREGGWERKKREPAEKFVYKAEG